MPVSVAAQEADAREAVVMEAAKEEHPYLKLFNLGPGPLCRHMAIISDGFKGTKHFVEKVSQPHLYIAWKPPHSVDCMQHLANRGRTAMLKAKSKGSATDNPAFRNAEIYNIARVSTETQQKKAWMKLSNYPDIVAWLTKQDPRTWTALEMTKLGIALYGHICRNVVEGENGCIISMRSYDPLKFVDAYILRKNRRLQEQKQEILDLVKKGKKLTMFASLKMNVSKIRFDYHISTRTENNLSYFLTTILPPHVGGIQSVAYQLWVQDSIHRPKLLPRLGQ